MPDSNALRVREYRRHRARDHSLCRHEGGGAYAGLGWPPKNAEELQAAARRRFGREQRQTLAPGCRTGDHTLCDLSSPGHGTCSECGKIVRLSSRSASPEQRRCRECQRANPRERATPAPRICALCDEFYVPKPVHNSGQRFCSKSCAQAWRMGARPPFKRRAVTGMAWKKAQAKSRRRKCAESWDGITDDEILERDGWQCQIPDCKRRPIRKDLKYPHPQSKSIDHIVPVSLGGADTAENKRAAHLGCNLARGNKAGEEQVALFGVIREAPLVSRTVNGVTIRPKLPPPVCACGNPRLREHVRCEACRKQLKADADARRQAAAQERRVEAENTAALHAEIRKLRAQGFATRAVAAHLGTSQRMVMRVGSADPVTGQLPR